MRLKMLSRSIRGQRPSRRIAGVVGAALLSCLVAACGSSGGSSGAKGPLTIGVIAPFTGSQAQLGPIIAAPCLAATHVINGDGGVLGHKLSCQQIDDYGDAADAVPNVSKALGTNNSIVAVSGIDSNVAATVVPIVNNAKIPMFSSNGLAAFDTTTDQYFWRNTAPDLAGGAAMGLWAAQKGYKRVALIFQNDVGDTGNQAGAVKALKQAGVQITSNMIITGDASSYQSTITRILAGHPDALMISTDEQTLGTLLAEYKTLNNGTVPPVVTDTGIFDPAAFSAVKGSVGLPYLTSKVSFIGTYVNTATPEFSAYASAVSAASKVKFPKVVVATGAVASLFDGINVMALAMDMAHSTQGSKFDKDIGVIAAKRPGAVAVHSYAQGAKDLASGKQIYYAGVTGPITFNKYHNSPGEFAGFDFTSSEGSRTLGLISPAKVASTIAGIK
jgi:ABC-type branched-subunit amino acid transport system substrate-binding protein